MSMSIAELTDAEIEALEPTYIGPTWRRARGPLGNCLDEFDAPKQTLGWQIAAWCTKYLHDIDGLGHWKFTNEQLRFVLWWYAVDEYGQFAYRKGVLQRLKGWGKDPLGAVLCLIEFLGPCVFSHWDENGEPVGKAHRRSWVQVAAVSRDQTRNTMSLMPALISQKLIETYGVVVGAELIRAHKGRCRLEASTSSYRSLEGGRSTFVLMNETHHWVVGNQGTKMYEVITGNTTKMNCRYLAITNAYLPDEDSVAQKMREAFEKKPKDWLYDSIEADERTPLTERALRIVIPKIRGDATWLNVDAIISQIEDSSITEARNRRMWLNQIVSDKDAIYALHALKAITREDASLKAGDEIVLGFDGGRYEDSSALVAIRIKDRVTFLVDVWEKPSSWDTKEKGRWEVNPQAVDSAVRTAFRMYKVKAFFADVNLWESHVVEWASDFGPGLAVKSTQANAVAWDMRNSVQLSTRAHERFMRAINDGSVLFDGDSTLRRHCLNARIHETTYGTYFRKESPDSTRKIDAYAAWLLAYEALNRYLTNPRQEKKQKTGVGAFM